MPSDMWPIGEKLRDIDQHVKQERGSAMEPPTRKGQSDEKKPYVTNRDPGDEETPHGR